MGYVQALTAEVNMKLTQSQEDKSEINRLREEINEWKKKYYDCRRKVVAQTQYVPFHYNAALRLLLFVLSMSIRLSASICALTQVILFLTFCLFIYQSIRTQLCGAI